MKRDKVTKLGILVVAVLLLINLVVSVRGRAAAQQSEGSTAIQYRLVRVDPSTNQELLFRDAGQKGYQLAGTIQIAGSTGWLVFR
jgi:hypothetical protein